MIPRRPTARRSSRSSAPPRARRRVLFDPVRPRNAARRRRTAGSRRGTGHEGARRRACERRNSAKGAAAAAAGGRSRHSSLFGRRACRQAGSSCTRSPSFTSQQRIQIERVPPAEGEGARSRKSNTRKKRASPFLRSSERRRRRRRRCIDSRSLSLRWRIQRPLGRLARAPIAIPGLLTGRHLSRAGGKERERGAEESDAGVPLKKTSFVKGRENDEKEKRKNFVRRRRRPTLSLSAASKTLEVRRKGLSTALAPLLCRCSFRLH